MTLEWHRLLARALVAAGALLGFAAPVLAASEPAAALAAREQAAAPTFASSPFGRALRLEAGSDDSAPRGDVDALLDARFVALAAALREPRSWCEILLLQTNVKRCEVLPAGSAKAPRLAVRIARRMTDAAEDANAVDFRFDVQAASDDYLSVTLSADEGPVGTEDYRLRFEAAPSGDAKHVFVHLAYAYRAGLAARLATSAYLASAGRDKVGFSRAAPDDAGSGERKFVGGIQGVAERNTMRYFLAIEAFLETLGRPREERLRRFHAALERYPAQLHETTLDEYLALKR